MHEEYKAIVDSGFLLQVDDPRLATHYHRHPDIGVEECRRFIGRSVDVVNHALRDLPEDRIRFHTCYSRKTASQLAVDRKVDQGPVARPPLSLQPEANRPHLPRFERSLGASHSTRVPWALLSGCPVEFRMFH